MMYKFKDGKIIEQKKPYNAQKIQEIAENQGIVILSKTRKNGCLYIETAAPMTDNQKAKAELLLSQYDITRTEGEEQ